MENFAVGREDQAVKSYDNLSSTEKADQMLEDLDLVKFFKDEGMTYVDLNEAEEIVLHTPNGDVIKVVGEINNPKKRSIKKKGDNK